MMTQQPPGMPPHRLSLEDESHLSLIATFHYVLAGLYLVGIVFVILHAAIMITVFSQQPGAGQGQMMPGEVKWIFYLMYAVISAFLLLMCAGNVASARYLKQRINRTFSFVIAGLNCVWFPFGTVLGIFSFIVLSRPPVRQSYEARPRI
jgi:hypothetical protein